MIFEKIVAALSEYKEAGEITPDTSFEELGLDSLDLVELLMSLEDTFGVTLEPDESIKTIKDLVSYIEKAQA